jgi:hypothetical protein
MRQQVPCMAMVPDHSPSDYDIKYVTAFKNQSQTFCLYTDLWGFQLQSNPVSTYRYKNSGTSKNHTTRTYYLFADHGVIGWSIGPAMNHYRHWTFYIPKTRGTRVSDTVVFLPEKYTMPATASSDRATAAIEELTEALKNPSAAKPFLNTGNKLNEAIAALTEMSEMNRPTGTKGSVTQSGQRTTSKEPIQKRTTSPQMNGDPRLARHRGTRGLTGFKLMAHI